ncbi:MAG: acyl-CoA thioesterase [Acidimicrobiales bacterium]
MSDLNRRMLAGILDLTASGEDRWMAPTPGEGPPRLFGGQVAAQALAAACKTVEADRPPHSLHGYFIRPGRPDSALELVVERTRDGRSFTTRHVTAVQEGNAIFNLTASFHGGEPGADWQAPAPDMNLPAPASPDVPRAGARGFWQTSPFELRPLHQSSDPWPLHPCWVRLIEEIPAEPALQACALTFISDMGVVGSARAPYDRGRPSSMASLDHAVWFHRPIDMAEWHLFSVGPVSNFGGRGLALGTIHASDGRLIASLAQEALIRPGAPDWMPPGEG